MIKNCPFCNRELIESEVKTIKGGVCKQINCRVHGHIDSDIQTLATRHENLKKVLGKYHNWATVHLGEKMSDIECRFTSAEWEAIEKLGEEVGER